MREGLSSVLVNLSLHDTPLMEIATVGEAEAIEQDHGSGILFDLYILDLGQN